MKKTTSNIQFNRRKRKFLVRARIKSKGERFTHEETFAVFTKNPEDAESKLIKKIKRDKNTKFFKILFVEDPENKMIV